MFRAEILWLANGPTMKMEGRLVGDWAEQARCLVTKDVVPKGLIVDLTEVSYVDSVGEQLLKWLGVSARSLSPEMSMPWAYVNGCAWRLWREQLRGTSGSVGVRRKALLRIPTHIEASPRGGTER
jgi:hypothetical protein